MALTTPLQSVIYRLDQLAYMALEVLAEGSFMSSVPEVADESHEINSWDRPFAARGKQMNTREFPPPFFSKYFCHFQKAAFAFVLPAFC
jgi:hypothetical protein